MWGREGSLNWKPGGKRRQEERDPLFVTSGKRLDGVDGVCCIREEVLRLLISALNEGFKLALQPKWPWEPWLSLRMVTCRHHGHVFSSRPLITASCSVPSCQLWGPGGAGEPRRAWVSPAVLWGSGGWMAHGRMRPGRWGHGSPLSWIAVPKVTAMTVCNKVVIWFP